LARERLALNVNSERLEHIMKIRYTDPNNKTLYGTTAHLLVETARVLIALGQAEEVPIPARGTNEWIEWRMEKSRMATGPHKDDVVPPTPYAGWEVSYINQKVGAERKLVILKHDGAGGRLIFDGPPSMRKFPDCPLYIIEDFQKVAAEEKSIEKRRVADAADRQKMERAMAKQANDAASGRHKLW
jgi:hypothetical protein